MDQDIKRNPVIGNLNNPNLPADFQAIVQKSLEKQQEKMVKEPTSSGPKVVQTGNKKLDDLIARTVAVTGEYEEITLPSGGKFYDDENMPTNGVLHVRMMTGEEEKILGTKRHVLNGVAVDMIFEKCIRERIDTTKLLSADRYYLLLFLRGISIGKDYDISLKCPECSHRIEWTVDLDEDITLRRVGDDFGPDNLSGELPRTKFKFTYRYANGRDEKMVEKYVNRRRQEDEEEDLDDTFHYRASLLIREIEGLDNKNDIKTLLASLPTEDTTYLRNVLTDPPFGADTKIQVRCTDCYEKFEVEMPQGANFFSPDLRKTRKTRP